MNPKDGGQSSSEVQRQTAATIARRKVLAAYAESAQKSLREAQQQNLRIKDEPISQKVNSESWRRYHSAWQNYYQKYYSDYYSRAAKDYIARERMKDAREKAEEEIMSSFDPSSKQTDRKAGLSLHPEKGEQSKKETQSENQTQNTNERSKNEDRVANSLKQRIQKLTTEKARRSRRMKRLVPIIAGITVMLMILFLQYNRLIFAPIMAYVSPGNVPISQIEAIDPTITQEISPEPRLIIPKLNIDVPINFGASLDQVMDAMISGVAHYRIAGASAYPGEIGNFVITGHSAGDIYSSHPYKYIFSGLERLEDGDLIYVNYNSVRYTYRIVKKEVIEPSNVAALVYDTDKPLITLVTCTPLGTSRYRLLVIGEQISPSYDNASEANEVAPVTSEPDTLPSNEPSFFERAWNSLSGQ
ncbi:class E sortase [Candidatus Saccharibacteria bacterium]|nr:class E sortase [Candidatus Saccharibacteria bacterium]